jgi:GTPase
MTKTYCGYVAIIGRPNVGKSTLLNSLVGEKVSISCHKRQTTRHVIHGIKTDDPYQIVYVDTPGIHKETNRGLNRYMNRVASQSFHDVDLILFVIDVTRWTAEDDIVLKQLEKVTTPVVLVVNKIDHIKQKDTLLPVLADLQSKYDFKSLVPISALKSDNIDVLESVIKPYLPESPFFFPKDQTTDRRDNFVISELIREKLYEQVHEEIPYSATIVVEKLERTKKLLTIHALIYVERKSQKTIIIGKNGEQLKTIGQQARFELEKKYDIKVLLKLWVKVKDTWADDSRFMQSVGYD